MEQWLVFWHLHITR